MRKLIFVIISIFFLTVLSVNLFGQGTGLVANLTTVDNICGQGGSATITINSSCSGNPTITWNTLQTGATINNLIAGSYSVVISDAAPCVDTIINFNIVASNDLVVSIGSSGDRCAGSVTLNTFVMGANPANVDFLWNNPAASTTQSITLNGAGGYNYSCTASYGSCTNTADISIIVGNLDFNVVCSPTICVGGTVSAGVNFISGTGPYQYNWSTTQFNPGITISSAGNYAVTVTDTYSDCSASRSFTVDAVPAVAVTIDYEDISCHDKNDAWATAIATGGTAPYGYMWYGIMPTATITQLMAGNYSVVATDSYGCTGSASVLIQNPPEFKYSVTPNQAICYGEQADINVNATGGVQPYLYDWSDLPGMDTDNRIVSPTETTTYTVTVLDANGCTFTPQTTTVTVSQPIVIDVVKQDVLCHGECTGKVTLGITGSTPASYFLYSWLSPTNTMQGLCVGDYDVTVTDMYGCFSSASFEITEPDTIYLTTFSGPATCFGYNDGFVEVDVVGGVPYIDAQGSFYNYQWTNGSTADSLATYAGMHSVTVTDANSCSHIASAFVAQPEAIYVTPAWGGTICIGESFSAFVNATGGTGPYDFVWIGSDAATSYGNEIIVSPDVTTTYQLITTDNVGCFGPIQNIIVNVNPVINIVSIGSAPADICIGETVEVEMEIEGGNGGPYTIERINHGIVNMPSTFYPNVTGYYVFEVSDDCGSPTDKDSIYVTVHPKPQVSFYADKTASCPPSLFVFTETTPEQGQTYLWDFGDGGFSELKYPVHTYSTTGTYDVSLTAWSEWGCKRVRTYENMITIYPEPRADFAGTPELVSVFNPMIEFVNYTEGGDLYFWDFGDGNSTLWTRMPQVHFYNDIGEYEIMLIAKNQHECKDTAYKRIRVHDEFTFYAPEAFTPNGDGLNDVFYVTGHGIDANQFYFVVYDRFGIKVFETNSFNVENPTRMAWDGTHNGSAVKGDPILTNGLYNWYCSFFDISGKPRSESGTVTLMR
ncbi:MAG: PKD domain-containing protein [Bacteroidales bacterium]|nr:PKD domain-containing protein [Bacteroidales bacterium]